MKLSTYTVNGTKIRVIDGCWVCFRDFYEACGELACRAPNFLTHQPANVYRTKLETNTKHLAHFAHVDSLHKLRTSKIELAELITIAADKLLKEIGVTPEPQYRPQQLTAAVIPSNPISAFKESYDALIVKYEKQQTQIQELEKRLDAILEPGSMQVQMVNHVQ